MAFQQPVRALTVTSDKILFTDERGRYTYSYRKAVYNGWTRVRAGKLMLRVSQERMHAFRTAGTRQIRAVLEVVTILAQGHGWYEVTGADLRAFENLTCTRHDALALFVSTWNTHFLGDVTHQGRHGFTYADAKPGASLRFLITERAQQALQPKRPAPRNTVMAAAFERAHTLRH